MYEVSQEYKRAIRKQTRKFEWQGTITTTNGKVYHFTTKDIVKGSGTLTRSCAGSTSLELGSVYAAELDISLFLDVDRYSMYDAVIQPLRRGDRPVLCLSAQCEAGMERPAPVYMGRDANKKVE